MREYNLKHWEALKPATIQQKLFIINSESTNWRAYLKEWLPSSKAHLSSENSLCNDHITCQNSVSIESSLRGFAEAISMSDRVRETSTEVLRNWSQWWGCEGDSYLEIVCLSKFLWYLHQYKLYKFLSSSSKLLKFLKMLVSLILSTRCTILSL